MLLYVAMSLEKERSSYFTPGLFLMKFVRKGTWPTAQDILSRQHLKA